MPDEKLDHYNPNYTYKKDDITIDKNNKSGYPMLERVSNGLLFPETIKNIVDTENQNTFD